MVHYFVLAEFLEGDEKNLREYFKNRGYLNQIREIKLLDIAVPEKFEDRFVADLQAQHIFDAGEFGNKGSIGKALRWFGKLFGLKQTNFKETCNAFKYSELYANTRAKFFVLGKLDDFHDEKGRELF